MVYEIIDTFGVFVAVDNKYSALIPHNEMSRELHVGDEVDARVKEVTEEGKLTLSLQQKLKVQMGMDAELILQRLENSGGFLPFHDKTSPEIIKREFCISKAAFKRAIAGDANPIKKKIPPQSVEGFLQLSRNLIRLSDDFFGFMATPSGFLFRPAA